MRMNKIEISFLWVDAIRMCTVNIYFVERLALHWFGGVLPRADQASDSS